MPRIKLSDGRTAIVSVKRDRIVHKKKKKDVVRHRVLARLSILHPLKEGQEKSDIAVDLHSEVICSEKDQFSHRFGRQEATRRLLKVIGDRLTRNDRRVVVETLCPEFFLTKIDRMRSEFERLKNILHPENTEPKVV